MKKWSNVFADDIKSLRACVLGLLCASMPLIIGNEWKEALFKKGFLRFIDSPDIREHNRNTDFTPAEWAVLVSNSMKKSVEEKIEALQYLADHYSADEFKEETIWPMYGGGKDLGSFY